MQEACPQQEQSASEFIHKRKTVIRILWVKSCLSSSVDVFSKVKGVLVKRTAMLVKLAALRGQTARCLVKMLCLCVENNAKQI